MSTDFSVKPVGAPVAASIAKPLPDSAKDAVSTDLPPSQTATASDNASAMRNDAQNANDRFAHDIQIDRAAAAIVYRVVDNRTGLVIRQYPDEARLRARAYYRQLDDTKSQTKSRLDQRA